MVAPFLSFPNHHELDVRRGRPWLEAASAVPGTCPWKRGEERRVAAGNALVA